MPRAVRTRVTLTVATVLSLLLGSAGSRAQPSDQKVDLDQAIQQGLARAELQGRGASSGDSLLLTLTNLTSGRLEVTIAPGTVLKSVSGSVQDMIVERVRGIPLGGRSFRPVDRIVLAARATGEFILLAYCLNFDRANPQADSRFSVAVAEYPEAQRLFAVLSQVAPDQRTVAAVQTAVWVITDDVTRQQLQARFRVTEADIAAARQLLERTGVDPTGKRLFR